MILVINSGSSSLKFQLFDAQGQPSSGKGLIERLGTPSAHLRFETHDGSISGQSLPEAFDALKACLPLDAIRAVGHRVVHGGEAFRQATRITPALMDTLESLARLAPLHNPANILGIQSAQSIFPELPMVAVFDTAFHADLPPKAYLYALPKELYTDHGIRRYGFHGTSHEYVSQEAARHLGKPLDGLKMITLHLGNGASAAAILGGKSVDTSMGYTPLEGLVMGTRSGDVDPGIVLWMVETFGLEETRKQFNQKSGLLGLSGCSHDLRDLHKAASEGDMWADRALEVMAYRIRKTIGSYSAAMNGLDAIVVTGGAGENDALLREAIFSEMAFLGIEIDSVRNAKGETQISSDLSKVHICVIPTDEERMIALKTVDVLNRQPT